MSTLIISGTVMMLVTINKKAELEKTAAELQRSAEVQENNAYYDNVNPEIKQEDSTNDVFIPPSNMSVNYCQSENEMHHYHSQVETSSRRLIFDSRDIFRYQQG